MMYVASDISGRLSADCATLHEVMKWMDETNPDSGDCVVWCKPSRTIAAIRHKGKWKVSAE